MTKLFLFNMKKIIRFIFGFLASFVILISLAQASKVDKNTSLIPAGDFFMGTEEGTNVERPVHKVFLREYKISRFEVTNLEFEKFQPSHKRSVSSFCDQCPVTMVNWFEANSYCKHKRGRLPSEAEWEKAGRGPGGDTYSFGISPDQSKGNYGRDFQAGAKIVNSYQPNGFGLHNMSGNVWEWVDDWFMVYAMDSIENLTRENTSNEKVLRGGSWYNSSYYVNLGMRFKLSPHIRLNSVGFRCVWDAY